MYFYFARIGTRRDREPVLHPKTLVNVVDGGEHAHTLYNNIITG